MARAHSLSCALSLALTAAAALFVSGCGGGGGGDVPAAPVTQGSISGNVSKGPVAGATVTAYAVSNGAVGPALSSTTTDAQGAFSISVGSYAGPVMLQASAGTYTDEATGAAMSMASGSVMSVALPTIQAGAALSDVQMTPLTSMAQAMAQHMSGGLVQANITAANTALGACFMVSDIVHTPPMNPLVVGSGSAASQGAMNYGMALAAMSQYAKNAGMASSSALVTAMMADASDGTMDGKATGSQITMGGMMSGSMMQPDAATSGLANAMADFVGSSMNKSGLTTTNVTALMQQLANCTGQLH